MRTIKCKITVEADRGTPAIADMIANILLQHGVSLVKCRPDMILMMDRSKVDKLDMEGLEAQIVVKKRRKK